MGFFKRIWEGLKDFFSWIWDALKRLGKIIQKRIIRFKDDIMRFMKDVKRRMRELYKRIKKKLMGFTIKQYVKHGNVNVVSGVINRETDELEDFESSCEGYESGNTDRATRRNFNGKDMIVYPMGEI